MRHNIISDELKALARIPHQDECSDPGPGDGHNGSTHLLLPEEVPAGWSLATFGGPWSRIIRSTTVSENSRLLKALLAIRSCCRKALEILQFRQYFS